MPKFSPKLHARLSAEEWAEIDAMIRAGRPARTIAARFPGRISPASVARHARELIGPRRCRQAVPAKHRDDRHAEPSDAATDEPSDKAPHDSTTDSDLTSMVVELESAAADAKATGNLPGFAAMARIRLQALALKEKIRPPEEGRGIWVTNEQMEAAAAEFRRLLHEMIARRRALLAELDAWKTEGK